MEILQSDAFNGQKAPSAIRCIKTLGVTSANAPSTGQKAPSAIRCIKTHHQRTHNGYQDYRQKAPSAIRCIKTIMVSIVAVTAFQVRKHLAP